MHIIIEGNSVDGLTFIGPFDSQDAAVEFADTNCDTGWLIGNLTSPNSIDEIVGFGQDDDFPSVAAGEPVYKSDILMDSRES